MSPRAPSGSPAGGLDRLPPGSGPARRLRLAVLPAALTAVAGCALLPPRQPSREEVLARILPTAVQVALERDGRRVRAASGVTIAARAVPGAAAECYVLTSAHALKRADEPRAEVFVRFGRHRGAGTRVRAAVLARNDADGIDLALLAARAPRCAVARLGAPPDLGEAVWVVAFPWGRHLTVVSGVVSQLDAVGRDEEAPSRLMVDASVSYGASGGGVFDARTGRLVGLVEGYRTARVSFKGSASGYIDVPVPGETYLVSLAEIRAFLEAAGYADLVAEPLPALEPAP